MMVQIGWYEIFTTVLLIIFVILVVLLFVFIGWFVVWKLILSQFRFFREILGMENGREHEAKKSASGNQPAQGVGTQLAPETPGHIRRRMERLSSGSAGGLTVS
ncbi:small integral membrane protein 13-like [Paramacrobiotus metropolitanus]|uniref:small integral membrane protein 13-like n=1 Tax=Paramacrobiotus metropolitanus TaxID=2943436 RepID=UPI002445EA34|nr:small integral membrane protein 13-like [Paramacrobiotus metropolitanus]